MKVYLDARCLATRQPAGVARYTLAVLNALSEAGHDVCCVSNKRIFLNGPQSSGISTLEYTFFRWLPGTLFIMIVLPFLLPASACFLGANHCVPLWGGARRIMFIHDFTYILAPASQTLKNRYMQKMAINWGVKTADKIVFVSDFSQDVFAEIFPKHKKADSFVLHNVPQKMESGGASFLYSKPFLFALGSMEPRKNLFMLLRAFERLRVQCELKLVIAGPAGWKNSKLVRALEESVFSDDIHVVGYLSDEEIGWHYENCELFCFPSLYEGFGIPAFEALLSGAKVVASRNTELRYFETENNLWLFDPDNEDLHDFIADALLSPKEPITYNPKAMNISDFLGFIN